MTGEQEVSASEIFEKLKSDNRETIQEGFIEIFEKLKSDNRETIQEGFIEIGKQVGKYGNVNYEDRIKFEHSIYDQLMYNYKKQYDTEEIMQKEIESISQLLENEIKRTQQETGKKVTSIEVTKERDASNCCSRWTYKLITD